MRTLVIPGLGRPVSRMILGMSAPIGDLPALYDRFVELGGNAVDTARWYDEETVLGAWLADRADRDDLVIVGKGCHPLTQDGQSRVRPETIEIDVTESLDRLGTDRIDLFLLHRDDPAVPVGEIVDALAREVTAKRICAYGGSNWTTARLAEASAWATRHGVPAFAASSPNLSLAVPVEPPWPGCLTAGDPASLAWYERTQLPLIAWSSLARGYFADGPIADDAEVLAAFDAPRNRVRRDRARRLAAELRVTANQVALAWVLHQPFPTFAVVGAATIAQLESSAAAVDIALGAEQAAGLVADR
jgi:aryl-alcohol dehydrogenase-like predicted oxidoreductase